MSFKQLMVVVAVLLTAACSNNSSEEVPNAKAPDTLETSIINRDWRLSGYEGVDGNPISFTTEGDFEFTIRFSSASDSLTRSVSGINVCNAYGGEFALEENVLSIAKVAEDTQACVRASEAPAALFGRLLFSENAVIVIVTENRLEILSGDNERLIFTDGVSAKVEAVEINSGDLTSLGNMVFLKPRYQFFRNQQALDEFHASLVQCPCTIEALPEIDFEKSTILFVAHEIANSGGYSIDVVDAEVKPDGITVEIQKTAPGFNCVVTDALTAPYQFYSVAGVHQNVDFVERPVLSPPCN